MSNHSNRLVNETSPYLLQHAHNPVDWFPWGGEALQKAKEKNKPILVSIGYAACHWCHVMEKESFEDEEIASVMNEHFINIKIDREERPDLDHIYMDAVQAMTGSGGWPLNVFLTPEAKPFYGGTYFPPRRAFNRSSWREVLLAVSSAFHQKRNEIDLQAENLTAHLLRSNSFGLQQLDNAPEIFSKAKINEAFQNLMKSADREFGGFGKAPKFPQTFCIRFLLRYYYEMSLPHKSDPETSSARGDLESEALSQACLSLDKMIEGGIYDQVGGGFARYSTDTEWLVPHFEKMLYDNALLVSVLAEAYQLTKNERYKEVIGETIGFVQRELMHPEGGFYSALDADSEGEEGKFYVWQYQEVKNLLGAQAEIFCDFFDITEKGNLPDPPGQASASEATPTQASASKAGQPGWGQKNIPHIKKLPELLASEKNVSIDEVKAILKKGKSILLSERNKRIRPALDDKIILGWNALMNTACCKSYAATGKDEYRQLAIDNMNFLFGHFRNKQDDHFYHTWKNEPKNFAFLDDYAFLIEALLGLQEITGDTNWLLKAMEISEYVIKNFSEGETGFFFFTDARQKDVIFRKKEVYDGATPSGNATMANNIHQLSILFNIPGFHQRAEKMITSLSHAIISYPASFGVWAGFFMETIFGTSEIAVVGEKSSLIASQILAEYIPHKVFMASEKGDVDLPLLAGKQPTNPALIYLCKDYSCLKPVSGVSELIKLVRNSNKN